MSSPTGVVKWVRPRPRSPDQKFISGDCGLTQNSSGYYGLLKSGAKFEFGMTELPTVTMPSGVTITAIASGNDQELALTSGGTVYAWGSDQFGQVVVQDPEEGGETDL